MGANFIKQNDDDTPTKGRYFYNIHENEDGTVDVYLRPDVLPMLPDTGARDYDVAVLVVKNVTPFDGMEEHIRAHYEDWCVSAEVIYL